MKIKRDNIEFISFNDGVCDVYAIDEAGNEIVIYNNVAFSERVLGFRRYFTASASQVEVNKVIRIPKISINNHDVIVIKNSGKYVIELVQFIDDTNPPCIDLTLNQIEMFGVS